MRKLVLASAMIGGLIGSTFAPDAFGAPGALSALPSAVEIQRMQERQSVLLDAHLAGMKAGLKLNDSKPKAGRPSNLRSAAPPRRAQIDGRKRATAWLKANSLHRSSV
jgi:hypothetical protein